MDGFVGSPRLYCENGVISVPNGNDSVCVIKTCGPQDIHITDDYSLRFDNTLAAGLTVNLECTGEDYKGSLNMLCPNDSEDGNLRIVP
eukprot:UN05420